MPVPARHSRRAQPKWEKMISENDRDYRAAEPGPDLPHSQSQAKASVEPGRDQRQIGQRPDADRDDRQKRAGKIENSDVRPEASHRREGDSEQRQGDQHHQSNAEAVDQPALNWRERHHRQGDDGSRRARRRQTPQPKLCRRAGANTPYTRSSSTLGPKQRPKNPPRTADQPEESPPRANTGASNPSAAFSSLTRQPFQASMRSRCP